MSRFNVDDEFLQVMQLWKHLHYWLLMLFVSFVSYSVSSGSSFFPYNFAYFHWSNHQVYKLGRDACYTLMQYIALYNVERT